MSHDPSRRLFLSGLPPTVTRKEIVEFIKKRTRANPMYVEIALDAEGKCKGFAHCTVEGLRSVVEALNGIPMDGNRIVAAPAKPHFSVPIMKAKKEREDAAIAEADARMTARIEKKELEKERKAAHAAEVRALMEAGDDEQGDDDPYAGVAIRKPDASAMPVREAFAGSRLKYAQAASEIADEGRKAHAQVTVGSSHNVDYQDQGAAFHPRGGFQQQQQQQRGGFAQGQDRGGGSPGGTPGGGGPGGGAGGPRGSVQFKEAVQVAPPQPPAPPAPPEPTKEAKKLANLQAKLAALKQKLGK
jgi:hypothetical protein